MGVKLGTASTSKEFFQTPNSFARHANSSLFSSFLEAMIEFRADPLCLMNNTK